MRDTCFLRLAAFLSNAGMESASSIGAKMKGMEELEDDERMAASTEQKAEVSRCDLETAVVVVAV